MPNSGAFVRLLTPIEVPYQNRACMKFIRRIGTSRVLVVCLSAWLSASLMAQTLPDAGALLNLTQQAFDRAAAARSAQRHEAMAPAMVFSDTETVTVTGFSFLGVHPLREAQLQRVVQPFANKTLSSLERQQLCDAVVQAYQSSGWTAQAYIPKQNLSAGVLVLQVIEGPPLKRLN